MDAFKREMADRRIDDPCDGIWRGARVKKEARRRARRRLRSRDLRDPTGGAR